MGNVMLHPERFVSDSSSESASVVCTLGDKSGTIPYRSNVDDEAGPIEQILHELNARVSNPKVLSLEKNPVTPLALVKITQSVRSRLAMALSNSVKSLGGAISIVGISTGSAPSADSFLDNSDVCCRDLGTSMRSP